MPRTVKPRCRFTTVDGDTCRRAAHPGQPYCTHHLEPTPTGRISEIAQELWERDEIKIAIGRLGQAFDQAVTNRVARLIDRVGGVVDNVANGQPRPQQAPPQAPRRPPGLDPRIVLGFGTDELLTAEKIHARRKELAKIFHPDKQGGNTDAMRRVNAAADALLARLS